MGLQFNQSENLVTCEVGENMLASTAPAIRDEILQYLDANQDWAEFKMDLREPEPDPFAQYPCRRQSKPQGETTRPRA